MFGLFSGNRHSIDAKDLATRLNGPNPPLVVDVREAHEVALGMITGSVNIPLGHIPDRVGELPPGRDIVVVCLSGMRSAQACKWLRANGFGPVLNLSGGLMDWARRIDPRLKVH